MGWKWGGHLVQSPRFQIQPCLAGLLCIVGPLFIAAGCSPALSTSDQLEEFDQAGPVHDPNVRGVPGIKSSAGPYRVVAGDILEFQMPAVLRVVSSDLPDWLRPMYGHKDVEPYLVRVNPGGTIVLPIIGEILAGGRTLAEVEAAVIDAYYPKYVTNPPMVVCEVSKYRRENERVFAVVGLVNKSGVFPYPPDVQYNLMEALAFAGGLDMVADPRYVKVFRQGVGGLTVSATFSIGSQALAEAYSVVIKPGDLVCVDHTVRTRLNKFLADVIHVTIGVGGGYTYN
jgi:protein involved in polysaccharide export with SLBB domain